MTSRNFRVLWLTSGAANLGDGLFKVTLPLVAVGETRSPALVANVTLAMTLPWAIFALPTGALVDRLDRRRLSVLAHTGRVAALGGLAVAATTHGARLPAIYGAAFVLGTCEVLANTAARALLPSLVGRSQLEGANARLLGTETVLNEFVGPPLAGVLVALSAALAFGATAGVFTLAAVAVLLLRGSFRAQRAEPWRKQLRADLLGGLAFIWRERILRTLSLSVAVMAGCWSAWTALLVVYAVSPGPVGLSTVGYGVLLTLLAAGGLAGTIAAPRLQRLGGARAVIVADIVTTALLFATPAATANRYLIGIAVAIGGFGSGMWNVVVASLSQRITPDELLGRAGAAASLVGWGTMPLGAALGGLLAGLVGIRPVLAGATVLTLGLLIPVALYITPANLLAAHSRTGLSEAPSPVAARVEPDLVVEGES
jgi:MFS family permease